MEGIALKYEYEACLKAIYTESSRCIKCAWGGGGSSRIAIFKMHFGRNMSMQKKEGYRPGANT